MRIAAFLLALFLVAVLVFAPTTAGNQSLANSRAGSPQVSQGRPEGGSGGRNMWRRAEIWVVPLDLAAANKAELVSLRARVEQAESDTAKLNPRDAAIREQLSRQVQLMKALLSYAERQDSDRGKSPTAVEVQRHLNEIEGNVMCEACHTGIVARLDRGRKQRR